MQLSIAPWHAQSLIRMRLSCKRYNEPADLRCMAVFVRAQPTEQRRRTPMPRLLRLVQLLPQPLRRPACGRRCPTTRAARTTTTHKRGRASGRSLQRCRERPASTCGADVPGSAADRCWDSGWGASMHARTCMWAGGTCQCKSALHVGGCCNGGECSSLP